MIRQALDRTRSAARGVLNDFKQLLSPPLCVGCDADLADGDPVFCSSCLESLRAGCSAFGPVCPFCGRRDFNNADCRCGSLPVKVRLYYWGRYEGEMIEYILKFKFHGIRELGLRLADEALATLSDSLRNNHYDYIIPVPLHNSRQRRRDFNQSEIIAGRVSQVLGVKQIPDSILRVRSTRQQAKIRNEAKRWSNVKNAFSLSPDSGIDFNRKRVLIVDDIVTTGATVYEASSPLRGQNPGAIDIFSLAYAG